MDNKGFAITGILYSILILFLVILMLFLFNIKNKKQILDQLKEDTIESIDNNNRLGN